MDQSTNLLPHQQEALHHVISAGGSGILAHATGSGKGLTSLAIAERMRDQGQVRHVLVVTPPSLRHNFFQQVLRRFAPSRRSVVLVGSSESSRGKDRASLAHPPEADYYVISGGLLRFVGAQEVWNKVHPDLVIADEVHEARNVRTGYYKELRALRAKTKHFLGLTGSLSSNSPADIAALVNLAKNTDISPASLEKNYFNRVPIKQGKIFKRVVGHRLEVPDAGKLASEIGRYVHVVSHGQVKGELTYPKVTRQLVPVEMSPYQKSIYSFAEGKLNPAARRAIRSGLPVGKKESKHIFGQITLTRQASNAVHPFDSRLTPEHSAQIVPKVQKLVQDVESHLRSRSDGRVIIYTHFVHGGVDVLEAALKSRDIGHASFTGSLSQSKKAQVEDEFRSGKIRVVILSPAGEKGLDFPDTTFVAVLDGHFNPERLHQAEARGIRAGGQRHLPPESRHVIVRHYQSTLGQPGRVFSGPMSVEQWMRAVAERKHEENASVLSALSRT